MGLDGERLVVHRGATSSSAAAVRWACSGQTPLGAPAWRPRIGFAAMAWPSASAAAGTHDRLLRAGAARAAWRGPV